jgi:hypothetical protein
LSEVLLETLAQRRVSGLVDHLGQRLLDLLLGVVDVTQGMDENVVR